MTTQPRGPDAGTLLVRALRTNGAAFDIRIDSLAGRPWASATFTGTRYVVRPNIRSWLDALPEADFTLRGHLVAELSVDSVALNDGEWRVTLTVLTLEDS
jgi:hypothetical protein